MLTYRRCSLQLFWPRKLQHNIFLMLFNGTMMACYEFYYLANAESIFNVLGRELCNTFG